MTSKENVKTCTPEVFAVRRHGQTAPFFQAKLKVGPADDVYEREADAVAEKVMSGRASGPGRASISPVIVQPKCAACEEEDHVQRKHGHDRESIVDANLEHDLASLGGGESLPAEVRSFYEPKLGYDFSNVKIHTNTVAAKSAQSINALAYTTGNNIVFNNGQYSPGTDSGKRLLGHELTHVVQQNGMDRIQRQPAPPAAAHRFAAEGVNVVVRASCAPAQFGFANVEAGVRAALNAIFNTACIETTRRTRIQRNLVAHGLDIRCRRSVNLVTPGVCAESTGFFIPANIFTIGSSSFAGHPDSSAGCQPIESTMLHEIVHLTRGFAGEQLPSSCEASCFGVGGGDPVLCRDTDVSGRRVNP